MIRRLIKKCEYFVYEPRGAQDKAVLALHGGGAPNGAYMAWQSGLNAVADKYKFSVIYPSAVGPMKVWNTGVPFKLPSLANDDVQFIQDVISDAPDELYACGISNGSHMCHRLVAELRAIRGVAFVAGARKIGQYVIAPSRPIPAMFIHGVQDTIHQPVGGGRLTTDSWFVPYDIPSTADAFESYATLNKAKTRKTQALQANKESIGLRISTTGDAKTDMVLLTDGGHSWPGGQISEAEKAAKCGPVSKYNASEEIWKFFASI